MSAGRGGGGTAAGAETPTATRPTGRIEAEQAALRRVATLVARAEPPAAVFAAVTAEVGQLLSVDVTLMSRYDSDDAVTIAGMWSGTGAAASPPVGSRVALGGRNVHTLVRETRRPARVDRPEASGTAAEVFHGLGIRSAVGVPIIVDGRLWGVIVVAYTRAESLPADAEERLAGFTELVATAIANAQTRMELRGFAEEQAALRRVATLVARAAPPEEVFTAVTAEVGQLLSVDLALLNRYDPDGTATALVPWSRTGDAVPVPAGTRWSLGGRNLTTLVFDTERPARIDDYAVATGPAADLFRDWGIRWAVGAPVSIEGRLWGFMSVLSSREETPPADTEERLAAFTELVGTAIANAQARVELRGFAEEQAALRRVATLVARAAPPEEVFSAVTAEAGQLLVAELTVLNRFDPDGTATVVGAWARTGFALPFAVGTRWSIGGQNVTTLVFETGRPARIDDYADADASGPAADLARERGLHSIVGTPVNVEGRLWGFMSVMSSREQPLPADTETRLSGFTELVATALADAEAQAAVTASRARIVAAADATRRQIERDLHDGAQQRLVSLALHLRGTVRSAVPPGAGELSGRLDAAATELTGVLDELRELARGLHPAVLAGGGLRPALKALARRSAVPVRLDLHVDGRLPDQVELAAYYTVAEALKNTAEHASATVVDVVVESVDGVLHVRVRDDGRGGADRTGSAGLVGLTDRVEALGGRLSLHSPAGAGTTVQISVPVTAPGRPGSSAAEATP